MNLRPSLQSSLALAGRSLLLAAALAPLSSRSAAQTSILTNLQQICALPEEALRTGNHEARVQAVVTAGERIELFGKIKRDYPQITGVNDVESGALKKAHAFHLVLRAPVHIALSVPAPFWTRPDVRRLSGIALVIALLAFGWLAFERRQIHRLRASDQAAKRSEAVTRTINYFATSLLERDTEEDVLWDLAKNCISQLGFSDCVIYLLDPDRRVLVQKAALGAKNPEGRVILQPITIPFGKGIVGSAAASAPNWSPTPAWIAATSWTINPASPNWLSPLSPTTRSSASLIQSILEKTFSLPSTSRCSPRLLRCAPTNWFAFRQSKSCARSILNSNSVSLPAPVSSAPPTKILPAKSANVRAPRGSNAPSTPSRKPFTESRISPAFTSASTKSSAPSCPPKISSSPCTTRRPTWSVSPIIAMKWILRRLRAEAAAA